MKLATDEPLWACAPGFDEAGLLATIRHTRLPLCVTDPTLPDNPIVYVNAAFCELTGYPPEETLGRNCRFLQGPATTPQSVEEIGRILAERRVGTVELVNYRKNGEAFINTLQIGPLEDENGRARFFFGTQMDAAPQREAERRGRELATRELEHRLRNIVNVMSVTIRMSARDESDPQALAVQIERRLRALSDTHFRAFATPPDETVRLRPLIEPLLAAYAPVGAAQLELVGADARVPGAAVSALTLALHELAANAVKHGALSRATGRVEIAVDDAEGLALRWRESGGPEVAPPQRRNGAAIIRSMVEAAGGRLEFDWRPEGLAALIAFPPETAERLHA